jgi:hypothetical protein
MSGVQGSVGSYKVSGGAAHFVVYTPIGDKLLNASAVDGTTDGPPNSNLNVSHCVEGPPLPQKAWLNVIKFYDANANGVNDDAQPIAGWLVTVTPDGSSYNTPVSNLELDPGDYTVAEGTPIQSNWLHTTPTSVDVTLDPGKTETVEFGNVCLGAGGGLTLGFWSNKNGQALGSDDLPALVALNLRNADGSHFDPATYVPAFRTWLLSANATNMAYMLSAQLAAMELNVVNGKVSGGSIVYQPGLGFITIAQLIADADAALGANGLTTAGSPDRSYQELLKNALDAANNNLNFVQPTPCLFSF